MSDDELPAERYSRLMRERLKKYGANIGRKRFNEWKAKKDGAEKTKTHE